MAIPKMPAVTPMPTLMPSRKPLSRFIAGECGMRVEVEVAGADFMAASRAVGDVKTRRVTPCINAVLSEFALSDWQLCLCVS